MSIRCRPQFRRLMTALRVHPCARTIPPMRALNESTRRAKASSRVVHAALGFALRAASAGSLRRVASKLASLARASRDHARIDAGLMLTEAWKRL